AFRQIFIPCFLNIHPNRKTYREFEGRLFRKRINYAVYKFSLILRVWVCSFVAANANPFIMSKENFLQSSIGKKLVMGITGLFLIIFLVVHVGCNSCIFINDGGKLFNAVAGFMAHNILIRIMEVVLFAGIFLHMIQALLLTLKNNKARPVKYAVTEGSNSKWYSRSMGILGSLLLIFFVVHWANFWIPTKVAVFTGQPEDTFAHMKEVFSKEYFIAIYLVGVISLCYHLLHGFPSAFQTLGLNHKKYTPIIKAVGTIYAIIVCLLFAAMPITMYLGIIK
ncbi:MAG: succinate dehydrogenase cytochrome b subunit, partial [Bacteroidia bacterium]